jgi:hypothetical protein
MRRGDFVFLFWFDEFLYGWGTIEVLSTGQANTNRQVTVRINQAQEGLAEVNSDIKGNPLFEHYFRFRDENLTVLDDDQARYLNMLCKRAGSSPPDPADAREEAARVDPLRPVVAEFIQGQRLPIRETRFDEFKTINSPNVKPAILKELDECTIAFLNLEDRRYEDHCRIFWGIQDKTSVVVGIAADDKMCDEIGQSIVGKLKGIQPPLAASSFFVQVHPVKDRSGSVIKDLVVIEVAVGNGQLGEFYCSQGHSFYIRHDGGNTHLQGQQLLSEIRHRLGKRT